MSRHRAVGAAVLLTLIAGCGDDPPAENGPFLAISGPSEFLSVEVRDADASIVWQLVAQTPAPLSALFWARVPSGFEQRVPADGKPPRPLVAGETLRIESVTPRHVFHHRGRAAGQSRLTIDSWSMELRGGGSGLDEAEDGP